MIRFIQWNKHNWASSIRFREIWSH